MADTTVSQIMSTPVVSVNKNKTLQEAVDILSKHKFSGLPVVDEDGRLTGIFSETDVIRYSERLNVVPLYDVYGWVSPHANLTDMIALRKGIERLSTTQIEKIITKNVITVKDDSTASEAAQIMNKRNINRLPVVDCDNRVVGIISRADLIKYMANRKQC